MRVTCMRLCQFAKSGLVLKCIASVYLCTKEQQEERCARLLRSISRICEKRSKEHENRIIHQLHHLDDFNQEG